MDPRLALAVPTLYQGARNAHWPGEGLRRRDLQLTPTSHTMHAHRHTCSHTWGRAQRLQYKDTWHFRGTKKLGPPAALRPGASASQSSGPEWSRGRGGRRWGPLLSFCCRQTLGWCGPALGSHLCRACAQLHTARPSGEDLHPVWRGSSGHRARQPGPARAAKGEWSGKWASGSGAHIRGLAGHRGRGGSSPSWPQGPAGTAQGQE